MTVWPVKTLGEVCEVARGTSITRKETKEGMIPVIAGGIDVAYFHSVQNRPAGTITVSSSGANAGFVNRWDVPIFASDCSTVVAKEGGMVFGDYAFRFLQFKQSFINAELRRGAAQPHVYAKDIAAIEISVPPLEEQRRIVALLDAATARVTELTACYEQARTHANNLFTSALREALESDQSAPLRTLDELCEEGTVKLGRGNIISKKDIAAKPGSYPIYSSARENEGKFGEYGDYMFDEEMITWSIDGGGRLFYRPKHKFSVTNVGGTLRVLDPRLLDIQYLHRVLQNLHSQRVFDWVFKAHPSVIRKVYDAIPMPPLAEQKRVVARLDSMRAKTSEMVAAYDAKLIAAKNLRQSILESAFEGKL